MANEAPNAIATILSFAEAYLKRPLTMVERQVLEAFVQNKPLDLSQASQQSVDQARQRAMELIRNDEQRTRQVIDQVAGPEAASQNNPQARELVLQQLLAAAGSLAQAPAAPPPPAVDDPALKGMITDLVQQEVKAAVEVRLAELAQKVEDTLQQVIAGSGQ
ncbi:hypothetical protein [Pseudomonas sp. Fl4BN1]|uniref:hypothetical protein n=1 Tax=Pseudomonas sp. Fl4BN1 TaxID=2697651 RepID=UPI0013768D45|nr:hypothetical protein [Pseudomonas sp. Fl4BN1]NBF07084.1 hypothetical protein [Pseudomonas sp. Fl4BN1]